jgi:hypothetical protein
MEESDGFEVLPVAVMKRVIFHILMPCSFGISQHFEGTYHLHLQGQRVSKARKQEKQVENFAFCSTLKMEAVYFSEMSDFLRATWHCNPENCTLRKVMYVHIL